MENTLQILLNIPLTSITLSVLGYIDPGTGSIILQAVVATFVGAAIAVKLFWHRILKMLGIRKKTTDDTSEKPEDAKK